VKKRVRRLMLHRETLVQLSDPLVAKLPGGQVIQNVDRLPVSQFPNCTSPLCMDTMCKCEVLKG